MLNLSQAIYARFPKATQIYDFEKAFRKSIDYCSVKSYRKAGCIARILLG
jgi:hypothetical protein